MTSRLSQSDVARLMNDPSAENRAAAAAKVAAEFDSRKLNDSEREIAKEIFRIMVKDAELRVREALSAHLKASPDLPHDVAMTLARDVESVALPVIRFSEVLSDDDLIEIVRGSNAAKQVAVAQRPTVSPQVAGALIDTQNEAAVARLLANDGAELDETAIGRVMKEYETSDQVSDSLARRPGLPAALSERLVNALSQKLQSYLMAKHELPQDAASNLILQVRERATISLIGSGSSDDELERLVEQLHARGRLTPSIVLRALCMGDMNFFEMAMAELANVPVQNARILIHDKGRLGLESIYQRTGMPEQLYAAVQAGVELAGETDYDGGENDRERFVERMLERILTQCEEPSERIGEEDIEYLMTKLRQIAA